MFKFQARKIINRKETFEEIKNLKIKKVEEIFGTKEELRKELEKMKFESIGIFFSFNTSNYILIEMQKKYLAYIECIFF